MLKSELIDLMLKSLEELLEDEGLADVKVTPFTPLIAGEAVISSISLASFVVDLETTVADLTGNDELTLVNEDALSRTKSPFRNVDAFADYVLELLGE
jgi:hypothetical protein